MSESLDPQLAELLARLTDLRSLALSLAKAQESRTQFDLSGGEETPVARQVIEKPNAALLRLCLDVDRLVARVLRLRPKRARSGMGLSLAQQCLGTQGELFPEPQKPDEQPRPGET